MKSALLVFCFLTLCGGMYSHKSPLEHQTESIESKKFITKMQTFDAEALQWSSHLRRACFCHVEATFDFYIKWAVIIVLIAAFLHCAYLVFEDVYRTITVYRAAELAKLQEQQRRIQDLKRRFNELVRNERIAMEEGDQNLHQLNHAMIAY